MVILLVMVVCTSKSWYLLISSSGNNQIGQIRINHDPVVLVKKPVVVNIVRCHGQPHSHDSSLVRFEWELSDDHDVSAFRFFFDLLLLLWLMRLVRHLHVR